MASGRMKEDYDGKKKKKNQRKRKKERKKEEEKTQPNRNREDKEEQAGIPCEIIFPQCFLHECATTLKCRIQPAYAI